MLTFDIHLSPGRIIIVLCFLYYASSTNMVMIKNAISKMKKMSLLLLIHFIITTHYINGNAYACIKI